MKSQTKKTTLICLAMTISFIALSNLFSSNLLAKDPARVIAGWVEKIHLDNLDLVVKAKLDTGARTSSINAKDISYFKKDGEEWVKFNLTLEDSEGVMHVIKMEKPRSRRTKIKNHNGEHDKRHVVDFELCFNGRKITTEFTLADRDVYIYDVLLGRRFLNKAAIVDSKRIFLTSPACE